MSVAMVRYSSIENVLKGVRMRLLSLFLLSALVVPLATCFGQQSSREDFQEFCKSVEGRAVGSTILMQDSPFGKKGTKSPLISLLIWSLMAMC